MAHNEMLAQRIRSNLGPLQGLVEKKMFGGVGFMLNGNMACGVHKDYLVVRVGPDKHAEALSRPETRVFDISGRAMAGWVMVAEGGYLADEDLKQWIQDGVDYALTLPAK